MRTEYILSEKEKAAIAIIDERIEMLNKEIFDLCMQKQTIQLHARVRYIPETDEERDKMRDLWYQRNAVFGRNPFDPNKIIVIKNNSEEKEN